jgi:ADP-ribosylglycohydrolase
MRAAIVGVFFHDDPGARRAFGKALAEVTHCDDRAVEGALYVAELAAVLTAQPQIAPERAVEAARAVVSHSELAAALDRAVEVSARGAETNEAAERCGTSGYVVETLAFATYCFLRFGEEPRLALIEAVSAGGDTDSIGAVLGGWLGARHGEGRLPADLLALIHDGPFGPTQLRLLAACLHSIRRGEPASVPSYSTAAALARNLALYPVVLAHGFRRLWPF